MPLPLALLNYKDRTPLLSINKIMSRQMKKVNKQLHLRWLIVSLSPLSRQKDQVKAKTPFKWTHLRRKLASSESLF